MNINGIKIRSSCRDVKLLTKREQLEPDRPTSVTHDYYDKWARRHNPDTETDSDSAGNNCSPRLLRRESGVRKAVFSDIPPEKYLRPESKIRRIIYRPESCCFATISEHEHIDNLRLSKSSLGFQMKPSFGVIPKDNSHQIMLEDVTNLRKKRTSLNDQATLLPMNSATLNFTENTVLRGDKYMFINQLYKRLKENKSSVRYSMNGSQKLNVIKPQKNNEKSVSRAQLIDFSEIKHILSLRREKLEKERLENLKKSDLMTFTVPFRKARKVKF